MSEGNVPLRPRRAAEEWLPFIRSVFPTSTSCADAQWNVTALPASIFFDKMLDAPWREFALGWRRFHVVVFLRQLAGQRLDLRADAGKERLLVSRSSFIEFWSERRGSCKAGLR